MDATNVIRNTLLAVFTSISRDHMGILGNSLEEIAAVKAGILKPGCRAVTSRQQPEVMEILKAQAARLCCPLVTADSRQADVIQEGCDGQTLSYKEVSHVFCPLAGRHQIENAVTALETISTLRALGYRISEEAVRQGLKETLWPGRFTCLGTEPLFFLDGAHNEEAAKRLRESLETYFPGKRFLYIMGVFRDKEYEKIASIMGPLAESVHTVNLPDSGRTLPAQDLACVMRRHCQEGIPIQAEESIRAAVTHALSQAGDDDVILAFGSLSCLGQVMSDYGRCLHDMTGTHQSE